MDTSDIGRVLIAFGGLILLAGIILLAAGRIPLLGHLPGDIVIERPGLTVFIPLASMLVVSLVVTLILNLIGRLLH
jgi:hypothetical protein